MFRFARKMQSKPPSLLWGHAHALYEFAKFLEVNNIHDIQPKGIFSAGMVLHSWEKSKIESVFRCKIQDRYGCEELGLIAAECKDQSGLHINTDAHYVEFLDKEGNNVQPGKRGFIVVTDLTNYAMPFIRYKLEDMGILSENVCSCGIKQPLINTIEGRTADFLLSSKKELISGISLTDHFAAQVPGVSQIQIVQEELMYLKINLVKDISFKDESIKKIDSLVKEFFGDDMKYGLNYLTNIPKNASGKFRFTICNIPNDQL
jgi:phenylacetate-CoA ligase